MSVEPQLTFEGVYGLAEVVKEGYPDCEQGSVAPEANEHQILHSTSQPMCCWTVSDKIRSHPYYDSKSSRDSPTWFMVGTEYSTPLIYAGGRQVSLKSAAPTYVAPDQTHSVTSIPT